MVNELKKIRDDKFTETDGNSYWLKLDGSNANTFKNNRNNHRKYISY